MKAYKLHIYKRSGPDKGNMDHVEYFDTLSEMVTRYHEFYKMYSPVNPTAWERDGDDWTKLIGY